MHFVGLDDDNCDGRVSCHSHSGEYGEDKQVHVNSC